MTTRLRRFAIAAIACCALAMLSALTPSSARAGKPGRAGRAPAAASAPPVDAGTHGATEVATEDEAADAATIDGAAEDAGDGSSTVGGELNLESRFVWRGLAFSQGPVVQPSAWLSLWGFTLELWGNVMLNDEPGRDRLSAIVPALAYTWTWQRLSVEPGVVLYYTPSEPGTDLTTEATLEVSYRLGAFRPVSGTYVDIQANPGAYYGTFGIEYERTVDDWTVKALLDVGWASADFNQVYFGVDTAAGNLIHGGLSVRYDLTDVFYFALHADIGTLLHPALRRSVDEPTLGSGGASIGVEY